MSAEADPVNRELVIIRRRAHAEGEAHHGGVWKIAYADFMTAMMAFFLVMWLINAANEETRVQVASYFNPVRLVDTRTSTKGLQDLDTGADNAKGYDPTVKPVKTEESKKSSGEETKDKDKEKKITEEALFREPFATLRQIAGPAPEDAQVDEPKVGMLPETANRPGKLGGKAYLDPFDPQTWQREPPKKVEAQDASTEAAVKPPEAKTPPDEVKTTPPVETQKVQAPVGIRPETLMTAELRDKREEAPEKAPAEAKELTAAKEKPPEKVLEKAKEFAAAKEKAPAEDIRKEAQEIEKEITAALGNKAPGASPRVEVKSTENGVLISLTDDATFGMFAIASAEPQPALVDYMGKIGKILNERPGKIVISGHTDARPFRSDVYDNWRLSTARAHMAYYMLLRGGMDEKRVERIEGHADRELKVPGDPEAAQNRRIEILLHEAKS